MGCSPGLTPGFRGPEQPTGQDVGVDPDVGPVGPFVLGATDTKNVHRSNLLMGHPYGTDFVYDEMLVGGSSLRPPAGPLGDRALDAMAKAAVIMMTQTAAGAGFPGSRERLS